MIYMIDRKQLPYFHVFHYSELTSTNDEAHLLLAKNSGENVVVETDFQTKGRGQKGNHWESRRAENLLYSIGVSPSGMSAHASFLLLEAASLAIFRSLSEKVKGLSVKWPNDIYINDRKLSGTLIENEIQRGCIVHSVLGTGINVNQETFSPELPNPVSLCQALGKKIDRQSLFEEIVENFRELYRGVLDGNGAAIHEQYVGALYRRTGYYPYQDDKETFSARIVTVEPDGRLVLEDTQGQRRSYAFKEVKYILSRQTVD